jgi:rfaE bifunctional protein nucleotidyltransferase chain/domain
MEDFRARILAREDLGPFRAKNRHARIVFTNGCFDVLHRGHVDMLARARAFGDCLVVGVNTDQSVARLKGAPRPLVGEEDRAYVLLALRSVDWVTLFEEDTPLETIMALEPDVLVKGAEYEHDEIVGASFVEQRGGRVERVAMLRGYSTTSLMEKLRSSR